MTKRELIQLLEASDAPDDAGICIMETDDADDVNLEYRPRLNELSIYQGEGFGL